MTSRIWIMLVGVTMVVALAIGLTLISAGSDQGIGSPATVAAAPSEVQAVAAQASITQPAVQAVADDTMAQITSMGAAMMQGAGNQLSLIDIAAQELGMTRLELVAELQSGKSILNVADERNVAIETILEAFIATRSAWLDTLVASGQITREFADSRLAQMRAMVPAQLNEVGLSQGNGMGMGPGNGQGNGQGQGRGNGQGQGRGNGQGQGQGPGQGTGLCQGTNMVDANNNGICDYQEQP